MRENTRGYRRKTVNLHVVELVSDVNVLVDFDLAISKPDINLADSHLSM